MVDTFWKQVLPLLSLLVLAVLSTGCEMETGPSLQVDVIDANSGQVLTLDAAAPKSMLVPTTNDSSLCCCRTVGFAQNLSTVPVNTKLKFEAYQRNADGTETKIGTALDFIDEMPPDELLPFEAVGILKPCDSIDRLTLVEVSLRGLWTQ